jgi:gluconate 2-dehydrogenase gamma chain
MAAAVSGTSYLKLGSAALATIAQAASAAAEAADPYRILTVEEARSFAAIAARIIPTTDTPGATEAGVIHFFDNAFAAEMHGELVAARRGLAEFNTALSTAGYAGDFSTLTAAQQDEFLRSQQDSEFFELLRQMTIFGFFAMSSYGGNRDHIGWDLIGFEGHHGAFTYPFGHYDAAYAKEQVDGE